MRPGELLVCKGPAPVRPGAYVVQEEARESYSLAPLHPEPQKAPI